MLNVLVVYAPNTPGEIRDFWKTIHTTVNENPNLSPNILLGDFNLVEDTFNRLPTRADNTQAVEALRDFKTKHNLIDRWRKSHPIEKGYLWSRESDGTQSRIDRIYVHENLFGECKDWVIEQPPFPMDHDVVSARIVTPSAPLIGKGRWAIPTRLLKNKKLKDDIQTLGKTLESKMARAQERMAEANPQSLLSKFKNKVAEIA